MQCSEKSLCKIQHIFANIYFTSDPEWMALELSPRLHWNPHSSWSWEVGKKSLSQYRETTNKSLCYSLALVVLRINTWTFQNFLNLANFYHRIGLSGHASLLGRLSQKKFPAVFLFCFYLHMTPRLWEDVTEVQQQAKLKDNVIFSAQGPPPKKKKLRAFN